MYQLMYIYRKQGENVVGLGPVGPKKVAGSLKFGMLGGQFRARSSGEVPGVGHLGAGRRTGQRRKKNVMANGLRTPFERFLNGYGFIAL